MKRTLLFINNNSGNASSVDEDVLSAAFVAGGFQIACRISLPDDNLPQRVEVEAQGFDTVAVCAGDGTVSTVFQACRLARRSSGFTRRDDELAVETAEWGAFVT